MSGALVAACVWALLAALAAVLPSRRGRRGRAGVLGVALVPLVVLVLWQDGAGWALVVLMAGASVLRWPVIRGMARLRGWLAGRSGR